MLATIDAKMGGGGGGKRYYMALKIYAFLLVDDVRSIKHRIRTVVCKFPYLDRAFSKCF